MRSFTVPSAVLALASAAGAEVVHADIWVASSGGQLVTSGWDHSTGQVVNPSQRVFEGELGVDPSFPLSGDEPGIGSNLIGLTLTMNLSSTLGAWNGSGFDFSTSALTASYGGQSASTGSGGSFSFLVTSGLDLHAEFTLSGPGATDPANGIYLATFQVASSGLATSETFWIVLNLGMSEEEHEAAVEWVEVNLAPAPGAIALLGVAGLLRRRRA
jgi:hypothetical protein